MPSISLNSLYTNKSLLLSDGKNVAAFFGDTFVAGEACVTSFQLSTESNYYEARNAYFNGFERAAELSVDLRFTGGYTASKVDEKVPPDQLATDFFLKNASIDSLFRVIYKKMEERNAEST